MTRHRQAFALAFGITFIAGAAHAAPPVPPAPPAKIAKPAVPKAATRQQIFDIVWRTVRDGHYDTQMNGVNWNAVRAKYLPQVARAKNEAAFYALMNTMLGELKESHLGVIAPSALAAEKSLAPGETGGRPGESGITAQWIDGKAVVVRVAEKSAGAEAGVKPGDTVLSINGKAIAPVLESGIKAQTNYDPRFTVWAMMSASLGGVEGKPYTLSVAGLDGTERTVTVTPRKVSGQIVRFGALPPIPADIETRTLPGNIGYVRFSIFLIPLLQPVKDAVGDFAAKGASAIIVDLRGNRGGIGVMANSIAGTFTEKEYSLGAMKTRTATIKFPVVPQAPRFAGKIVILTDEGSVSTSEIMAAGLQEAGRATVIGRKTAGMVLPSQIVTLPGGGRLQYVVGDFRTPKGVFLEGRGVLPDVAVNLTPATLAASASGDPVLDAALQFLEQKETNQ